MIDWESKVLSPCIGVFGEPATYKAGSGAWSPVSVVFDNAYKEITWSDLGTELTTIYPIAGVALSDFPSSPVQGDQLKITRTGKTYVIREVRLDSHGGALLILNYVSG